MGSDRKRGRLLHLLGAASVSQPHLLRYLGNGLLGQQQLSQAHLCTWPKNTITTGLMSSNCDSEGQPLSLELNMENYSSVVTKHKNNPQGEKIRIDT